MKILKQRDPPWSAEFQCMQCGAVLEIEKSDLFKHNGSPAIKCESCADIQYINNRVEVPFWLWREKERKALEAAGVRP